MLLFSCKKNNEIAVSRSGSHYLYEISLKEKVICSGDTSSYLELSTIYSDDANEGDMLAYSLIMANKYNYPDAYYDVFDILNSIPKINGNTCLKKKYFDNEFNSLDKETRNMAIKYFKLAIYKGSITASEKLLNYFNIGKEHPVKEFYLDKNLVVKAKFNLIEKNNSNGKVSNVSIKK